MSAGKSSAPSRQLSRRGGCLWADLSFDGKLLEDEPPAPGPLPVWWRRLVSRRHAARAQAATVRALLEEPGKVRELCVRVHPRIAGSARRGTLGGPADGAPFFERSATWTLARMAVAPDATCLLYYRRTE